MVCVMFTNVELALSKYEHVAVFMDVRQRKMYSSKCNMAGYGLNNNKGKSDERSAHEVADMHRYNKLITVAITYQK